MPGNMSDQQGDSMDVQVLKKYKLNKSDRTWVNSQATVRVGTAQMNWTDYETTGRALVRDISSELEKRFDKRFPLFGEEVAENTVKGRNRDNRNDRYMLFYVVALVVTFFLSFVGFIGLFLLVLFVGGWINLALESSATKYNIPDVPPYELLDKQEEWLESMRHLVREEVGKQTLRIFYSSTSVDSTELRASVNYAWRPLGPRPLAPNGELTPREAELYVTAYMKFYGATGVVETRYSRDGGIDVESDIFIAQVKHQISKVGVKAIRETYAVATARGKIPLFFTKVGFSQEASVFANEVGMSLFTYLPHLKAENSLASTYLKHGMTL